MEVRSDRTYLFRHPPEVVWEAIARTGSYQAWWPWLRRFDADGLVAGDRWHCTVRPPLPYVLQFTVVLEEVTQGSRIVASVTGDIGGTATVDMDPTSGGSSVRLRSSLVPTGQPLRGIMRWTPWLPRYGHDWVLDTGLNQFRRRAFPG